MMGPGFADGIGQSFLIGVILLVVFSFTLGAALMWGVPKVWVWLMPIIHAWTA
jgi:hypothetical protein